MTEPPNTDNVEADRERAPSTGARFKTALGIAALWYLGALVAFMVVAGVLPDECPNPDKPCDGFTRQGTLLFVGMFLGIPATLVSTAIAAILVGLLLRARKLTARVAGHVGGAIGITPILVLVIGSIVG